MFSYKGKHKNHHAGATNKYIINILTCIQASNKNIVPSAVAYHAHDVSIYQ